MDGPPGPDTTPQAEASDGGTGEPESSVVPAGPSTDAVAPSDAPPEPVEISPTAILSGAGDPDEFEELDPPRLPPFRAGRARRPPAAPVASASVSAAPASGGLPAEPAPVSGRPAEPSDGDRAGDRPSVGAPAGPVAPPIAAAAPAPARVATPQPTPPVVAPLPPVVVPPPIAPLLSSPVAATPLTSAPKPVGDPVTEVPPPPDMAPPSTPATRSTNGPAPPPTPVAAEGQAPAAAAPRGEPAAADVTEESPAGSVPPPAPDYPDRSYGGGGGPPVAKPTSFDASDVLPEHKARHRRPYVIVGVAAALVVVAVVLGLTLLGSGDPTGLPTGSSTAVLHYQSAGSPQMVSGTFDGLEIHATGQAPLLPGGPLQSLPVASTWNGTLGGTNLSLRLVPDPTGKSMLVTGSYGNQSIALVARTEAPATPGGPPTVHFRGHVGSETVDLRTSSSNPGPPTPQGTASGAVTVSGQ